MQACVLVYKRFVTERPILGRSSDLEISSICIQYADITTYTTFGEEAHSADIVRVVIRFERGCRWDYLAYRFAVGDGMDMEDVFLDG